MNRRYITLSSLFRNRTDDPNPFEFTSQYRSSGANKAIAFDWVSNNAPLVQFDMGDYFLDTDADFTAPYRWRQTGSAVSVIGSSPSNRLIVTIDARKNGGSAPDPVTGQYVGLTFEQGSNVSKIVSFTDLNNGSNQYELVIEDAVGIAAPTAFEIFTDFLDLNQVYVPTPVNIITLENAYTGFDVAEYEEEIISDITDFDATTRIITGNTNFTLAAAATFPDKFFIAKNARFVTYTVDAIDTTLNTIEITADDNPNVNRTILLNNYIYHFPSQTTGKITGVELPTDTPTPSPVIPDGQIRLTIMGGVDLSSISISDEISILFYSNDNSNSFNYQMPMRESQWQDRGQVRTYDLELISLQIPNKVLTNHPGGLPINYPYFFVDVENLSSESRTDQIIYSNNPNVDRATFISPVMDISTPEFSSFTKLDGNGFIYPFNIKANDTLKLRIRTPTGETLTLAEPDTVSPASPNVMLQVTAIFSVTSRPKSMPCFNCDPSGVANKM